MFTENANRIFNRVIEEYHRWDDVDRPVENPYEPGTIDHLLYHKNWIDTVQWHLEDIIRDPQIDPVAALAIKRRIDKSNQERTDMVEYVDSYLLDKYREIEPLPGARLNTETPAWAIDRLSILALKIYHMACETERTDVDDAHRAACRKKLDVLLAQQADLSKAIEELIEDIEAGRKYMKTYKQMKMYNDPALNPVLYGQKSKKLPRHLIVYRTSAMGDVAMLAHALRALKRAYPDLQVTVATRPLFRAFFTDLDVGFLDVDVKGAHHSLCGIWRLAAQARRLGADAVADVHGVLRSVTFRTALRLHGIPFAAIGKGRDEKGEFIRRGGRGVKPAKHTVVRYCDVFRKLGFVFDDPKPAVRREHPSPMGEKTGTWIGFAPFSAQQGKTYPEPLARETVRLLAGRYDRVFIHSGGGAEAEFAQEMERLHPNVTALFGRVKMAGEIDLIANLDCVVSMDSLVMHLASLVATPVVSVWGATHPGLGFFGYGCDPRGIVQADMECRPCSVFGNKPCRYGDYRCLHAVTPAMIVERVEEIVGK